MSYDGGADLDNGDAQCGGGMALHELGDGTAAIAWLASSARLLDALDRCGVLLEARP